MSLLHAGNLAFRYPTQSDPLFEAISFEVNPGDRIGLIGPNGAGKTTLLRVLAGEITGITGALVRRQSLIVSYIRQVCAAPGEETLEEHVLAADPELKKLHNDISSLESGLDDGKCASHYADLLESYEARGGYRFEAEARKVLAGLGFSPQDRALTMGRLSSGLRARAELARLLLAPADLLLIDEPTNHLDIAAREWLERYLEHIQAPYVLVTHDRVFLNRTVERVFELRRGILTIYSGNYEFYVEQRALRGRQAWEHYAAQQQRSAAAHQAAEQRAALSQRVAKAPKGIRHGKDYYASKASRVARTARILRERIKREPTTKKPWVEDPIPSLEFPNVRHTSGVVLRAEGLSKSYGGKRLFQDLSFGVQAGEHWAILGPNGCGKSTLLRILLGLEIADQGKVHMSGRVRSAYYAQEGENLDANLSPIELCLQADSDQTRVRTILGCLRLRGEDAQRILRKLSAGEQCKVALARILLSGANLLLLDEMTNHLDIESQEAAEQALLSFPGTILFVSHDRYFISKVADEVLDLSTLP